MYAVTVCVEGSDRMMLYGPYKTRDKADEIRLKLGECALAKLWDAGLRSIITVVPLCRSGADSFFEEHALNAKG